MPYPGGRLRDGSAPPPQAGCILSNWGLTVLKGDGEWERLPSSLPSLEYLPLKCKAYISAGYFWSCWGRQRNLFCVGKIFVLGKKIIRKELAQSWNMTTNVQNYD